jgi:hypothetical protein
MADAFEPAAPASPRPFLEFRPLLRALGIASDARKLILASVGLLALWAGWSALAWAFVGSNLAWAPALPVTVLEEAPEASMTGLIDVGKQVTEPFRTIAAPLAALFARGLNASGWLQSALMAAWAIAVWGIAGGAIARIAVVQAANDRRVGLGSALRFALGKSPSLIGAPLTPMLAVAIFAGSAALFGLACRAPWGIGVAIAWVLGFVPLLLGLVMALILVGLAIGWPLMHVTVAAEGEDAPDALSRSYSYVNQRMARYAAHILASLAIGGIGLGLAILMARVVLALADWGVGLGTSDVPETARLFWTGVVGFIVHGWVYSYFWSAASIIYLILRRDVDGTSWNDVFLPDHAADTFSDDLKPAPKSESPKSIEAEVV